MRKLLLAPLIVCTVALLSTPYLSARAREQPITLKSNVFIDYNWNWVGEGGDSPFTWIGTVTGDINGDFYVSLVSASFPGMTEKFSETWIIETADGEITGYEKGTWSFINFNWGANGKVTTATGVWSQLVGYDMRYSGTTSDPNVPRGEPIEGNGILIISSY